MSAGIDERFQVLDPSNPWVLRTTGGSYGDIQDVVSGQDNGLPAYSESPIFDTATGNPITEEDVADVRSNPDRYAYDSNTRTIALPADFYQYEVISPGDPIDVTSEVTGKTTRGIAGEVGPSAKTRGIDLPPGMLQEIGADTDTPLIVNFKPHGRQPTDFRQFSPFASGIKSLTPIGSEEEEVIVQPDETDYTYSNLIQPDTSDPATTEAEVSDAALAQAAQARPLKKLKNGDTVFDNGMTLHASGFVSVTNEGRTSQINPWTGKVSSWKAQGQERPIFGKDGLPYTMKEGKLVRIPMEGDEEDVIPGAGEAALDGLNPGEQEFVKRLSVYDLPLTTLGRGGLSNPYNRKLIKRASFYNPNFDFTDYPTKQKVKIDYKSGKSFTQIKSLNNAIGHIRGLFEGIKKMGNADWEDWNELRKHFRERFGSDAYEDFGTAAEGVATEIPSVISGKSATIPEMDHWAGRLRDTKSTRRLNRVVDGMLTLLSTRVHDLYNRYEENLGYPPDFNILDERSKQFLKEMGRADMIGGTEAVARGGSHIKPEIKPTSEGSERIIQSGGKYWKLKPGGDVDNPKDYELIP